LPQFEPPITAAKTVSNLFVYRLQCKLCLLSRSIAEDYCNEIFPKRLYLGDWHHAKDPHVINTLGITHILNISDSCENYLEESHRKCPQL
jgi:hypothetical protein